MYIQKGNTMMFPTSSALFQQADIKSMTASLLPNYKPERILFKQVNYSLTLLLIYFRIYYQSGHDPWCVSFFLKIFNKLYNRRKRMK